MNYQELSRDELIAQLHTLTARIRTIESGNGTMTGEAGDRERALFQGSTDPIILTSLEDTVLEVNPAVERVFGYTPEEIIGRPFPAHEGLDEGKFEIWLEACRTRGGISDIETVRRHKDGRLIPVSITVSPVKDNTGEVKYLSFSYRDITPRVEMQSRLRQSEAQLRSIIDTTRQSYILINADGSVAAFNRVAQQRAQRILAREMQIGASIYDYALPEHRASTHSHIAVALSGQECSFESRFDDPAGKTAYVAFDYYPVFDDRGTVIGATLNAQDITERKMQEQALRESEERLELVLEAAQLGWWDQDQVTNRVIRNKRWATMLGYTPEEIGESPEIWEKLVHPDDLARVQQAARDHEAGLAPVFSAEHRLKTKSGEWKWVLNWGKIVERSADGRAVRGAGIHMDIDERVRAEQALKESERRYRTLFETSPIAIVLMDTAGNVRDFNPAACMQTGYAADELAGRNVAEFDQSPDDEPRVRGLIETDGLVHGYEFNIIRKSGATASLRLTMVPIELGGEQLYLSMTEDVTQAQQAEKAQRYRAAFERLIGPISSRFINLHCGQVDREIQNTLKAVSEFVGSERSAVFFIDPETQMAIRSHQWTAEGIPTVSNETLPGYHLGEFPELYADLARLRALRIESADALPKGPLKSVLTRLDIKSMLLIPLAIGGELQGCLSFDSLTQEMVWTDDVTSVLQNVGEVITSAIERQRTEIALRDSEEFSRAVFEHSPVGISVRSATGKLLGVNQAWRDIWAVSEESLDDYFYRDRTELTFDERDNYLGPWKKQVGDVYQNGGYLHIPELRLTRKRDGKDRWVSQRFKAIMDDRGHVDRVVILTDDITESKQTELELRTSEERFRLLAESVPGVIYLCKNDGRLSYEYLNDRIEELTGYKTEQFLADEVGLGMLTHEDDRERVDKTIREALERREPFHVQYRLKRADGRWLWAEEFGCGVFRDDNGELVYLESFLHDITEQVESEQRLREREAAHQTELMHADRLRTVGRLAAGVAHEINNPLSVLYGTLQEVLTDDSPELLVDRTTADQMLRVTKRIKETVHKLLVFSRQRTAEKSPQNVNEVIEDTLSLVNAQLARNAILLTRELAPDLPSADVNAEQIKQVLLNLILNAIDAMPQGGRLLVRTRRAGEGLQLTIKDTGAGVPEEDQENVFTPFFTTKEVGAGTGLGLAICYGIVKEHGGEIRLQSEPGRGAEFVISLPVIDK